MECPVNRMLAKVFIYRSKIDIVVDHVATQTDWTDISWRRVQNRLMALGMTIDQFGISGRRLLSNNAIDKRFWAARRAK